MKALEDLFQESLERLESGVSLAECQIGLPAEEAELLALADSLRLLRHPVRRPEVVQQQRSRLVARARQKPTSGVASNSHRPGWMVPLFGFSTAAAFLLLCLVMVALTYGFYRSNQPVAQDAVINQVAGVVEIQEDGSWRPVYQTSPVGVGQHIRTGPDGTAFLALPDGSLAYLGANTEMWLADLTITEGQQQVHLVQGSGESRHEVAAAATYLVETPAGNSTAKGTIFSVFVPSVDLTRVTVQEGIVEVTGANGRQEVTAGKVTMLSKELPPRVPTFVAAGSGTVVVAGNTYAIAGQSFVAYEGTTIASAVKTGDTVYVEGHIAADGTVYADAISMQPGTGAFWGQKEVGGAAASQPENLDCVFVASMIAAISGNIVTLENGSLIDLNEVDVLEGTPGIGSSVLLVTCTDETGSVVLLILIVLGNAPNGPTATPTPTIPVTMTVTPGTNGTVTLCHYPPGHVGNAHTIVVGAAAVAAHLAHGDTPGPCATATPTLTPTATITPTATTTVTATATFTATSTITPTLTQTATPTMTPAPTLTPLPPATPTGSAPSQVTICHIPGGNPANAHTITVSQAAVATHLAHGDTLGACPPNSNGNNGNGNGNNGNGNGNGNGGGNGNGNGNGGGNGNGNGN